MHLLELEKNWRLYEIVFFKQYIFNLKDFLELAEEKESISRGGVVFFLRGSKNKVYLRPKEFGNIYLAQKLTQDSEWLTVGEFRKFNEIKINREREL